MQEIREQLYTQIERSDAIPHAEKQKILQDLRAKSLELRVRDAVAEDGEDDEDGGMEVGHGRMRRQIFDFVVYCGDVEDLTTHPHLQRKSPQSRRYFKTV